MAQERQGAGRPSTAARALVAVTPPLLFLALTLPRLRAQGLEYDELFQAPGAFAWLGLPVPFFVVLSVGGVPLLNMSYAGALKTALYGLYLRTGAGFGVVSWRLTALLCVALGLGVFFWTAARRLPRVALAITAVLLLTDVQLLLSARFDWGPVALAFLLRMLFLSACLGAAADEGPGRTRAVFLAGLCVGLGVFEKLSGVALLVPLLALVLAVPSLRSARCLLAAAAGTAVGASPLALANLVSWRSWHGLISLGGADGGRASGAGVLQQVLDYLALAPGARVREHVLGVATTSVEGAIEAGALAALLAFALASLALAWPRRSRSPWWTPAALLVTCWAGVGVVLSLLPAKVMPHHLMLGTPFQYLAIGLGAAALVDEVRSGASQGALRATVFGGVLVLLVAARLPAFAAVESRLVAGASAGRFRPDYTAIGEFGARRADDTLFVASGWGVATQIFCLANGRPDHVVEPFWAYGGPQDLERLLADPARRAVYIVRPEPEVPVTPEATRRIEQDFEALPGWRAAPLEPELARMAALRVRKYVRR